MARERALRLLTVRSRGREELSRVLRRGGFEPRAVRIALEQLTREGWLDDLAAARSLVRWRGGRYGRARIERELYSRGFSRETVEAALEDDDSEAEEKALVRAFERLRKKHAKVPPALRRKRIFEALRRRGFPAEEVFEIMKRGDEID